MTGHPLPRASRRATLGGLVVGLGASGCEVAAPPADPSGEPTRPTPEPDADPDTALVESVVEELTAALALVTGAARARRALGGELAPWEDLHTAHLTALEADVSGVRPLIVTGSVSVVRRRVRGSESRLQRRLGDRAAAARSGSLASLLATMSAAVAQQLAAPSDRGRS